METEIFWEVDTRLNSQDMNSLSQFISRIDEITHKFQFFTDVKISEPMHLNIIITDDFQIQEINLSYRKKNKATDVLTFSFDQTTSEIHGINCAEIYISQDTALKQSQEQNLTLLNEFIILIVHGLLHAFHYDHEESREAHNQMRQYEKEVLNYLGIDSTEPLTN